MNINERCLFEGIAQAKVDEAGTGYPVECPVRIECFEGKYLICMRAVNGEIPEEIVGSLMKSAEETKEIADGLFKKQS